MRYLSLLFLLLSACSSLDMPTYRRPASMPDNAFYLAWPIKNGRISRGFSPSWKNHFGIDIVKPLGSPIRAAHSGRVVYAGSRHYRGYGKLVIIEHPSGWGSMYAHCHRIYVKEGQYVKLGDKIASVGRTGRTTGAHLHFELRKNKAAVDPMQYLP